MTPLDIQAEPWRAVAPEVREISGLTLPRCEERLLPNGVRLHILDMGEAEVNRLGVVMSGGDREAPSAQVARLSATMLREGTRTWPSDRFADLMEFNGSWIDTSSHTHHRAFHIYSLNSRFLNVVDAVTEMIVAPAFDAASFEVFREKQARSVESDRHQVSYRAARACDRLLFGPDHPAAIETLPDDVRAIRLSDITAFHDRAHAASGIDLFLSGRITPGILEMVTDRFSSLEAPGQAVAPVVTAPRPADPGSVAFTEMPDALQSAVRMAIPTIPRSNDDYEMLRIVVTALGGYFGSRLNSNIREEKGLTYGITAALMGFDLSGAVVITCQTDPANVDAVIDEVRHELHRMSSGDFSDDELTRLRRFYLSSMAAVVESPFSIMDFMESRLIAGIPDDYFANQLKALDRLSNDTIAAIARKYLDPSRLLTSIAGPRP